MNSSIGRTASPPLIDDQLEDNVDVNGDYDDCNNVDYGCEIHLNMNASIAKIAPMMNNWMTMLM